MNLTISILATLALVSGCLNLVLWHLRSEADASADCWRALYFALNDHYATEYEQHPARDPKTGRFTSRKRKGA